MGWLSVKLTKKFRIQDNEYSYDNNDLIQLRGMSGSKISAVSGENFIRPKTNQDLRLLSNSKEEPEKMSRSFYNSFTLKPNPKSKSNLKNPKISKIGNFSKISRISKISKISKFSKISKISQNLKNLKNLKNGKNSKISQNEVVSKMNTKDINSLISQRRLVFNHSKVRAKSKSILT